MVARMHAAPDRKYWGASRGRSATDCAWLQAARSESNQVAHKYGVLIVADWSKYYGSIPLHGLRVKFQRHGAPTCWLKLAVNMWSCPRIIRL
eukprot:7716793-Pyramimonas_sp.AAC.1